MTAFVRGLGTWFPETVRDNGYWPEEFVERASVRGDRLLLDIPEAADRAGRIAARYLRAEASDPFIGAQLRRIAASTDTAAEAEAEAAKAALDDAGLEGSEVDYVISYSVTIENVAPATCSRVAHEVGARRAMCWGVEQACASALVQLTTARALVESGAARHVLLTQSHLFTRAFPMMHPAVPGLGDAASAIVVSADRGMPILSLVGQTHAEYYDSIAFRRSRERDEETPWWTAGPDFVLSSFHPDQAKQLMRDTVAFGADMVNRSLAAAGVDKQSVAVLAAVQPRGWIPGAIAECVGIAGDAVSCTYEEYAHLGASGPVVNWAAARERAARGRTVLYAQGAGFTRAAAVFGPETG